MPLCILVVEKGNYPTEMYNQKSQLWNTLGEHEHWTKQQSDFKASSLDAEPLGFFSRVLGVVHRSLSKMVCNNKVARILLRTTLPSKKGG